MIEDAYATFVLQEQNNEKAWRADELLPTLDLTLDD